MQVGDAVLDKTQQVSYAMQGADACHGHGTRAHLAGWLWPHAALAPCNLLLSPPHRAPPRRTRARNRRSGVGARPYLVVEGGGARVWQVWRGVLGLVAIVQGPMIVVGCQVRGWRRQPLLVRPHGRLA